MKSRIGKAVGVALAGAVSLSSYPHDTEQNNTEHRLFPQIQRHYAASIHEVLELPEGTQKLEHFLVRLNTSKGELIQRPLQEGENIVSGTVTGLWQPGEQPIGNKVFPLTGASTVRLVAKDKMGKSVELGTLQQNTFRYTFLAHPEVELMTQGHIGELPYWRLNAFIKAYSDVKAIAPFLKIRRVSVMPLSIDGKETNDDSRAHPDGDIRISAGMLRTFTEREMYVALRHELMHHLTFAEEFAPVRSAFMATVATLSDTERERLSKSVNEIRHYDYLFRKGQHERPDTPFLDEELFASFLNTFLQCGKGGVPLTPERIAFLEKNAVPEGVRHLALEE